MNLRAQKLRQQLEGYSTAYTEAQRAELENLANQVNEQARIQIGGQERRQLDELRRRILEQTKELRNKQRHYQDQYRELLDQMKGDRDTV
jgi:hypothetical protein